jgi:hypothetical protein
MNEPETHTDANANADAGTDPIAGRTPPARDRAGNPPLAPFAETLGRYLTMVGSNHAKAPHHH